MADISDSSIEIPRTCDRQTQRINVAATSPREYFRRCIYLPFLDSLISQLELRFGTLAKKAIHAMCLIPSALHTCNKEEVRAELLEVYGDDLPDTSSLDQERKIWDTMWSEQETKPETISKTQRSKSMSARIP